MEPVLRETIEVHSKLHGGKVNIAKDDFDPEDHTLVKSKPADDEDKADKSKDDGKGGAAVVKPGADKNK